jgi:hypothetical protein
MLFDEQHVLILALFLAALRASVLQLSDTAVSTIVLYHLTQHCVIELLRMFLE